MNGMSAFLLGLFRMRNHVKGIVSTDFFTVPTAGLRLMFVFLVLAHDRRRVHYHQTRTHLALEKDASQPREVMTKGKIVALPQVGGLHHRYERRAA
jgi:hypothetical protein